MAIVRTAIGTAAVKGVAYVQINSGIGFSVGDVIIALHAGDDGDGTKIELWRAAGLYEESTTVDVVASNSGNVVTQILRLTVSVDAPFGGGYPYIRVRGTNLVARAAAILLLTGLDSTPFDKSSTGTGSGTTPSSGATATTSQADEILIGAVGTEGPDGDAAGTWSNSFNNGQRLGTTGASAAGNVTISEGYLVVSSAAAYTAAKTGSTSRDWAAAIATYKGQAAGTQYPQSLTAATASFAAALVCSHGFTKALTSGMAAMGATISRIPGKTLTGGLAALAAGINKQTRRFLVGG